MSRRLVLILALCALAIAAVAIFPWTLTSKGPERMLTQQLRRDYGLDVSIHGRSTLAFLPTPRIKVEEVEIKGISDRLSVRDATLRGGVSFLSLLRGQIELSDITLTGANTVLDMRDTNDAFWANWATWMQLRINVSPIKRIVVSNSSLTILRENHPDIAIDAIDIALDWPENAASLSLTGGMQWNGKTLAISKASLFPAALLSGKNGPFALEMSTSDSQLSLSGTIQMDRSWNVTLDGKSALRTRSLRELVEWADLPIPLSPLIEEFSIEGTFSTNRNLISWPSVNIMLGRDKLEGSLSFRLNDPDHAVSGTLAAETIDLSNYLASLAKLDTTSRENLSFKHINRADLDLRLSATSCTVGNLKLSDLALGFIVKPDRLEASLGRVSIDRGIVKGRLLITGPVMNREAKLQGSVENLNLSRLAVAKGTEAMVSGVARGQIAIDGSGATLSEILSRSHGKANVSVTGGEIKGIDIPALLRQGIIDETVPPSAFSGGSTSFDTASLGIILEAGIGFITDGTIQSNGTRTTLNGDVSLVDGTMAINAVSVRGDNGGDKQLLISATGNWSAPEVAVRMQDRPRPPEEPTHPATPEENPSGMEAD